MGKLDEDLRQGASFAIATLLSTLVALAIAAATHYFKDHLSKSAAIILGMLPIIVAGAVFILIYYRLIKRK